MKKLTIILLFLTSNIFAIDYWGSVSARNAQTVDILDYELRAGITKGNNLIDILYEQEEGVHGYGFDLKYTERREIASKEFDLNLNSYIRQCKGINTINLRFGEIIYKKIWSGVGIMWIDYISHLTQSFRVDFEDIKIDYSTNYTDLNVLSVWIGKKYQVTDKIMIIPFIKFNSVNDINNYQIKTEVRYNL